MSKLDELRKLEAGATKGPWEVGEVYPYDAGYWYSHVQDAATEKEAEINAKLISAARNAMPALLKVVEAARDLFSTDEPFTNMCRLKDALIELEETK